MRVRFFTALVALVLLGAFCLVASLSLYGGERGPIAPSPKDKCPVCGMFVKKYPDWTSQIVFKDGSYAVFDGAKDLFKYYQGMPKYGPGRRQSDIDSIYVTDYYSLKPANGREAYYVIGSDVFGPMGRELVPFASEADAKEFTMDHKGKAILKFVDVTQKHLKGLE